MLYRLILSAPLLATAATAQQAVEVPLLDISEGIGGLPLGEQAMVLIDEIDLAFQTVDLAVVPDGLLGFVRCEDAGGAQTADERLMAIDMSTGAQLPIVNHDDSLHARGNHAWAGDAVVVSGRHAVTAGSDEGTGTVFIDVYGYTTATTPPTVVHLMNETIAGTGRFNDLRITPDGRKAVVSARNVLHVLDLTNAGPSPLTSIPLTPVLGANTTPGWSTTVTVAGEPLIVDDWCVDSVEVDDSYAFVSVRGRADVGCSASTHRPVAFVIDLQVNPPAIVGTPIEWEGGNCFSRPPHDLAMATGNTGPLAMVSATRASALIDLATASARCVTGAPGPCELEYGGAGGFVDGPFLVPGQNRRVCDSVAMGSAAGVVVRSTESQGVLTVFQFPGPGLDTFELNLAGPPLDRPIDVTMVGNQALVAADRGFYLCTDLLAATPNWLVTPGTVGTSSIGTVSAFLSDAVVASGTRGATIRSGESLGEIRGSVMFANLGTGTAPTESLIYRSSDLSDRLTDIAVAPDGSAIFVRGSQADGPNASGNFFGLLLDGSGGLGEFSLGDTNNGLDHVEAGPGTVLTIGDMSVAVLNY